MSPQISAAVKVHSAEPGTPAPVEPEAKTLTAPVPTDDDQESFMGQVKLDGELVAEFLTDGTFERDSIKDRSWTVHFSLPGRNPSDGFKDTLSASGKSEKMIARSALEVPF